jgi:DNA-binding MarR family transcriptional regulator
MNTDDQAKLLLEVIPRMMRVIRGRMRLAGKDLLTVPQFRVLIRLSKEPQSNQELASWMGVSPPTMSKTIDKLVRRGLLRRKAALTDRRQITIECTPKGVKLALKVRGIVQRDLAGGLSALPETKRAALVAGLHVIRETFL